MEEKREEIVKIKRRFMTIFTCSFETVMDRSSSFTHPGCLITHEELSGEQIKTIFTLTHFTGLWKLDLHFGKESWVQKSWGKF